MVARDHLVFLVSVSGRAPRITQPPGSAGWSPPSQGVLLCTQSLALAGTRKAWAPEPLPLLGLHPPQAAPPCAWRGRPAAGARGSSCRPARRRWAGGGLGSPPRLPERLQPPARRQRGMGEQGCQPAEVPRPPDPDCVGDWWDMVRRNLQSIPGSCSTLRRKIVALYSDFTSKSLKEHIFPPLMKMLIFLNFYKAPYLVDLKKPEKKMAHTVNFYVKVEPGVFLGIWHTVPSCRHEDAKEKDRCWYEAALHDGNPIVIYLHGSARNRAASNRLKLVKVLSDGGFHVLSVDYRGFGDSTGKATEKGLTMDVVSVYEWTKARSGGNPVCLWGHSLGTGVATNAARVLEEKGCPVDAVILESPFTNIWVATINYPLLKIYRKLPGFLRLMMDSLREDNIFFPNDENVKFLSSPLLILHGEDDNIVPLEFGIKLYEIAYNAYRHKERVKMVIFPPGFRHNFLYKSPMLLATVRDFLSKQWA
ncbi:PREDICTED: abhydrolase domain-containing protein 12B [Elephantulus edwardii]|uniref:abhydrolase domain-containing protein 12B n=1 Tax=Elephantulus edwardii TaxID=28737 RepID=UPI0003F07FC8|nr:PREDICTED: abhydrolase domain-containing protein 12B [Elephantulus edwardii]